MRNLLLAAWAAGTLLAAARADDPLIVRPKAPGTSSVVPSDPPPLQRPVIVDRDPDRPGFLIIRPQRPVTGTVLQPIGQEPRTPTTTPTEPRPASTIPVPAPIPSPGSAPAAPAKPEDGKLVLDTWDVVYLKGQRVGYFHVTAREYERDGKKFVYATKSQRITVARFGQVVEQTADDATLETADGAVLTTLMTQGIGADQKLSLSGKVTGKTLTVTLAGAVSGTQQVPWPDGVLGVAKEATLFSERKPKVGETIEYLAYEGRLNRVVKFTAAVKEAAELVLVEGEKARKVLRVELAMAPIDDFQLPPSTLFLDAATYEPLRMDSDVPMLGGRMTVLRTTKQVATLPVGKVPDLFDVQSIPLDKPVPNVHDQAAVVYKFTTNGSAPVEKLFPTDDRQVVKNANATTKSLELHVTANPAAPAVPAAKPGEGCLSSSFFIDWDNDAVKGRARQAAAGLPATATPLDKARAVERWVNQNMRATEFSQAMATCSNVAKSLSGDCTEYAMLSAGMCRALGVPSRTAIGLVYAPGRDGKPYLAYHMWFEAWTGERWVALDATLGRGRVGPGHLKITAADWHEERSFAPLLPVLTVLGAGPKVEVLKVSP